MLKIHVKPCLSFKQWEHVLCPTHSFSFASTTYGLRQTPRGFWSWSQETRHSTFWSAPSSLFVWLMKFPSSPMTWPRWSSPKTAWPCWRDWGPWGFSVSLYCCCPGLASPHPASDGHLVRGAGGGWEGDPLSPLRLKWGTDGSQEPALCFSYSQAV